MSLPIFIQGLIGKSISRGKAPKDAAMFQIPLDFTGTGDNKLTFTADFSDQIRNKFGIAGIQSVKIDNRNNSDVLMLTFDNGEVIVCPSYAQGIFPVLFSGDTLSFTAYSSTGIGAVLTFLNTREQAQLWAAKLPIAGTLNVTGSTIYTQKSNGTWTDRSAAIAVGGTSQLFIPQNALRKTFAIRNPATPAGQNIAAIEPCYVSFGGALGVGALGTWELLPGETLPLFDLVTTEAIYINAATVGHRVTAKEM